MVETLSELLESAANVAEDNGGKLSIASAAVLIAEAYELGMDKATKLLTEDRKRRLEDPIVFRATKIGIVIVSMWGEEASDSMFDKYR